MVIEVEVIDPTTYADYMARTFAIVEKYSGR